MKPNPHNLVECSIDEMAQKYPARMSAWGGNRSIDPNWMTDGSIMLSSHAIPNEQKRYKYENLPPKDERYKRDISSERLQEVLNQSESAFEYVEAHFVGYRELKIEKSERVKETTAFYAFHPYEHAGVEWVTFDPRKISLVQSLFECSLETIYIHRATKWESHTQPAAKVYKMPSIFVLGMPPDALIMPMRIHPDDMPKEHLSIVNSNGWVH